jgi:hypothetical protein
MPTRAALGIKLHTGWAVVIAVAGNPSEIQILLRRRIELMPPNSSVPRFVYHQAAEMPLPQATDLVKCGKKMAEERARLAVRDAVEETTSRGLRIDGCGVLFGSTAIPNDLAAILGSHPLIHAAEGALFRDAIVLACESLRLQVRSARERDVWAQAASAWNLKEPELRKNLDSLRKSLGAPWSADHKAATAVALLALKSRM